MKTALCLSVLAGLLCLSNAAYSQLRRPAFSVGTVRPSLIQESVYGSSQGKNAEMPEHQNAIRTEQSLDKNVLFSRLLLVRRAGDALFGWFVGLSNDTLSILANGQTNRIPLTDIARLKLEIESSQRPSKSGVTGMILGTLIGDMLVNSKYQPFSYVAEKDGFALYTALFAAGGGALGYLLGLGSQTQEEVYTFTGSENAQAEEWSRFHARIYGGSTGTKLELSFQCAQVDTRLSSASTGGSYYYYDYGYDGITSFNLMRRLQLAYHLSEDIKLGGAVIWFGEPRVGWGQPWVYNYSYPSKYSYGTEQFTAVGYFVVGCYEPLKAQLPKVMRLGFGAGIGAANIDYRCTVTETIYDDPLQPYQSRQVITDAPIEGLKPAIAANAELGLYVYETMSIGFTLDYVVVLGESLPALSAAKLESKPMGNTSYGFTVGFHF